MKIFDYSELIRVINNVENREEEERVKGTLRLKDKYNKLEYELIESGILDDWNRLKYLCEKAKIRLCVAQIGDKSIGHILGTSDVYYCKEYADDGMVKKCMSSGSHWSDYYGFKYEVDKGIVWEITHSTGTSLFTGFKDDEEKYKAKIYLLETFKNTYEHYREFQLRKIEEKFSARIKTEDIIK